MSETPTIQRIATLASASGGRLVSVESSASAGFMAPLHAHEADEAVHVLEGSVTVYAGEDAVRLAAGETFVVRQALVHTFRAESARTRLVFTTFARSAARYEDFLRAAGPVVAGTGWSADEDAATVAAVATAARITVFGPPGTLPADVKTARAA